MALNADTGKYIWHYQETPGDNWDYTSTQPMILADINIDGAPRKVILHAPKNGFFFVIDRTNGKFISAKNFVDVNWATGYDANGRPIEVPAARGDEPYDSIPGPYGAHNWHPMSFNPQTGLVYLPAQGVPVNLTPEKTFKQNAQDARQVRLPPPAGTSASCWMPTPPKTPAVRTAAGLGSGEAEGSLARGICGAVERRHADHRRQSGVPGHGGRALHRLQCHDRRKALGSRRPAPAWSRRPRPI